VRKGKKVTPVRSRNQIRYGKAEGQYGNLKIVTLPVARDKLKQLADNVAMAIAQANVGRSLITSTVSTLCKISCPNGDFWEGKNHLQNQGEG
jgi:hypothetical protein